MPAEPFAGRNGNHRPRAWPLLLALTAPSLAGADGDHDEARRLQASGAILPLAQILAGIRDQYPGRILEAELDWEDERYVYEIEYLGPEGHVWELSIDAASGELLNREAD